MAELDRDRARRASASGRDLGKIGRKLREFARGPVTSRTTCGSSRRSCCRCRTAPLARARQPRRSCARRSARLRLRLGIERLPAVDVPAERRRLRRHARRGARGLLLRRRVVDVLATSIAKQTVARRARAAREGRRVFAINHALAEAKRAVNPQTFVSPHGVDHALFARALDADDRACPRDLAALPAAAHRLLRHAARLGRLRADRARRARAARLVDRADRPGARRRSARCAGCRTSTCSARSRTTSCPRTARASTSALIPYRIDERMHVRQPAQAARVPVGRPAGRVDAGARGRALRAALRAGRATRRRVRRGDRARARRADPAGAAPRARRR